MSYICIHNHFYQPPRENPWLEAVEQQDSAYPYHDWNERVTAECYAPNSASRILDQENRIVDIVNNYSRMSFNFGPTLLSWLETFAPRVYQSILSADRESREQFGGHGSALSQAYNHIIMPLANSRDKLTQVIWASPISNIGSAGNPRRCGCPRWRLIWKPWKFSHNAESSLPSWLPARRNACVKLAAGTGGMLPASRLILRWSTACASLPAVS